MTVRQCSSCGGFCKKSGCERENVQPEPKQEQGEPVAMQMDVIVVNLVREGINKHRAIELAEHFIKHTTPQQRKPLTDEQIEAIWDADTTSADDCQSLYYAKVIARAIEAAHGIKE